ncbi:MULTISPECIES: hypothetical protein [unclassified Chryseobacterium]|uniref:hypothetical protein n=1 Tax=unclassified Chryseobacterium TaxID=2593645 RepID=UPI00100B7C31|nr:MULTISPECIES: hypothetical protein [unclassified Chryseobacterium]RXM51232.1 hypothetical protein BOQ64_14230 [Chryseobacterium sp. CH25]RXM64840.1 hypothetical protein BOQ60_11615 [Chryseobacterium sp. CH1]
MKLRDEIEPDFETAEKRYPEVLKLVLDYADWCDEHGDEDNSEYKKLENKLHAMTGKEMSQFNLWEWWEGDGAEHLSFDISLPDPQIVENITKDELTEIVRRMNTFEIPDPDDQSFKGIFYNYICFGSDYFTDFLKLNFKGYDIKLFQAHKDKDGNYYEYSQEEITDALWKGGLKHSTVKK